MNPSDDDVVKAINRRLVVVVFIVAASFAVVAKLWESVRERDEIVGFDREATRWFMMRRTDGVVSVMRVVTRFADVQEVTVGCGCGLGLWSPGGLPSGPDR